MLNALQIVTATLVGIAMTPALAHALELPGKMRLSRDEYFSVQRIYYPGFTMAGIAEPASLIASTALLLVTPSGSLSFWLTVLTLAALAAMQAVYWLSVHPVNRVWLKNEKLGAAGAEFFGMDRRKSETAGERSDWTTLRDRWEYSHAVRAGLAVLSFLCLITAVVAFASD